MITNFISIHRAQCNDKERLKELSNMCEKLRKICTCIKSIPFFFLFSFFLNDDACSRFYFIQIHFHYGMDSYAFSCESFRGWSGCAIRTLNEWMNNIWAGSCAIHIVCWWSQGEDVPWNSHKITIIMNVYDSRMYSKTVVVLILVVNGYFGWTLYSYGSV